MGRLRTNTKAPELIREFKNYKDIKSLALPKKVIHIEIGSGKGDFLIQQATNNPNIFYIGIEKYSTVILKALKKIDRNHLKLPNLIFCCADAMILSDKKFKNKISKIYLNFSDPWPKKRHAKRRLTSPNFLDLYKNIVIKDSLIEFKTDNKDLYLYTVETLQNRNDIKILYKTTDLYKNIKNKFNKENIQTEYEKKFVSLNKKINKVIWFYTK